MLNSLSNDEISDSIKLKAFAGNKIYLHVGQFTISVFDTVESFVGRGENAG